ncbi:MAG: lipopolysaccharide biosynthesis protein [Oscillospiraceae bacterium]|nr:lipopolysaccharide biosynthesis protein [Oscillospiraceae bacterium]
MKDISIKKAAAINASASYICVILQIVFNGILARILSPEDYGIVTVVTVFTTFFTVISNMGIGPAIIQNKELTEDDISNIFSFNFYAAIVISLVFVVFSVPMAHFYENSVYIPIGALLAISLFFHTMNIVPHSYLLKQKRFMAIGVRMIIVNVTSNAAAIVIAFMGYKYYALVWQAIVNAMVSFLWNYSTTGIKFRIKFSFSGLRKILSFSMFQMGYSIINYFSKNIDNLVIGKYIGDSALGFYDKAYKVTLYPQNNLTNVITPTLHPILSSHQNDKEYIYTKYMEIVKVLSLLGMFIGIYCYFASEEIIGILFGNQWGASVPCIAMLSLSIWAQMITGSSQAIFQSAGNPKNMFISGLFTILLTASAIAAGIFMGDIVKISLYLTIAFNLNFFVTYYFLIKRTLGMSYLGFLKSFIPELGIAALVTLAGFGARLITAEYLVVSAFIKGVIMGIAYILGLLIFRQHRVLISFIKR